MPCGAKKKKMDVQDFHFSEVFLFETNVVTLTYLNNSLCKTVAAVTSPALLPSPLKC